MQKTCAREKGDNGIVMCAENESSEQRFCRSSARLHPRSRTMLPDTIEMNTVIQLSATCPAIPLAVRYAGSALTRFTTRPDGRTPFQFCSVLHMFSPLCVFGESVFAMLADHQMRSAKFTSGWISRCWWGRDGSSDEHLVCTKFGLLKCKSVRRKPTWRAVQPS